MTPIFLNNLNLPPFPRQKSRTSFITSHKSRNTLEIWNTFGIFRGNLPALSADPIQFSLLFQPITSMEISKSCLTEMDKVQ